MLKIGYTMDAHIFPLYWQLEQRQQYSFVTGFIVELNKYLREGAIDVSFVSSLEYMNRSENYLIMPGICVSSSSANSGTVLFSDYPITKLSGKRIAVTNKSLSGEELLHIVMDKFYGVEPVYVGMNERRDAQLLIRDEALEWLEMKKYNYTYDLSELWYKNTGLPYVSTLCLASANAVYNPDLTAMYDTVLASANSISDNVAFYADEYVARFPNTFSKEVLINYWKSLNYVMGEKELKGLDLYFRILGYEPQWYFWERP